MFVICGRTWTKTNKQTAIWEEEKIFGIFENSCIRAGTTGTMLLMHLQGRDSGSALQEARFVGFGLFGLIPATLHVVVFLVLSNNHLVFLVLSMSMHFLSPLHLSQCHSFHFPFPPSFSHSCSEDPFFDSLSFVIADTTLFHIYAFITRLKRSIINPIGDFPEFLKKCDTLPRWKKHCYNVALIWDSL